MSFSTVVYTGIAGLVAYLACRWWNFRIPRGLKHPPGPPGHFLIGNLLDLLKSKEWSTFDRWAKQYGSDVCFTVTGDMFYLLEPITSIRFNLRWALIWTQYGKIWRNQTAVEGYHEIQMKFTKVLLKRLYRSPESYRTHIRYIVGAAIIEVTYGIQTKSEEDPFIVLSETTMQRVVEVGIPGTFLVDLFPICKRFSEFPNEDLANSWNYLVRYIPLWFPGANFLRESYQIRRNVTEMLNRPVDVAKNVVRNGGAIPSAVSVLIEKFENDPNRPDDYEDIIKNVSGVAYVAAIDTKHTVTNT
ncbi:hypothetical protein Clacol_005257 [Clathrus columnatus]|uniref:Cytochrome P450 n=1 Tax=Clathrus columnatus TaxID=1419009 RepID=A0AAV5A8S2_9AGAM|nr:hypothetical protein Clacol_005257 [Clathrus columnatus]